MSNIDYKSKYKSIETLFKLLESYDIKNES
jgi:hypothetical protein